MTSELTYNFDTPKDYIIADINGQKALIDTGSPVTVGCSPFFFDGRQFSTWRNIYGRDIDSLSQDVSYPMTHLVGLDVLQERPFLINWQDRKIIFYPKGTVMQGEQVPLDMSMGLQLRFIANGQHQQGILDTGAPVTFKPKGFPSGSPIGQLEDFHPTGGKFITDIYQGEMQVGSRKFQTRFGEIPGLLGELAPWIVGSDFWKAGPVGFDIWNRRLHLFSSN